MMKKFMLIRSKKLSGKRLPIMDRIEIHFLEQESARWNSFNKSNEIQYTWIPSLQLKNVLKSKNPVTLKESYAKKYNFRTMRELGFTFFEFNMDNKEIGYHPDPKRNIRNKALRCAIRKAFNWKQRINRMYGGIGEAFPGIIPPGVDGFDSNLDRSSVELDIKSAKQDLKTHGWNTNNNLPVLKLSGVARLKQKIFCSI